MGCLVGSSDRLQSLLMRAFLTAFKAWYREHTTLATAGVAVALVLGSIGLHWAAAAASDMVAARTLPATQGEPAPNQRIRQPDADWTDDGHLHLGGGGAWAHLGGRSYAVWAACRPRIDDPAYLGRPILAHATHHATVVASGVAVMLVGAFPHIVEVSTVGVHADVDLVFVDEYWTVAGVAHASPDHPGTVIGWARLVFAVAHGEGEHVAIGSRVRMSVDDCLLTPEADERIGATSP